MSRTFRTLTFSFVALFLLSPAVLGAHDQPMGPPRGERGPRGDRLMGTITAIGAESLTVETRDGASYNRVRRVRHHPGDAAVGLLCFDKCEACEKESENCGKLHNSAEKGARRKWAH